MDSLTLAMSNSTAIDTKDKLLVALLKYLLNLLDTPVSENGDSQTDGLGDYVNDRYNSRFAPKIVPFRTIATNA